MAQKSDMRPEAYTTITDQPFRPNRLVTGVLAQNDRPEYGATYRRQAAALRGETS
jgi:2-oxoglutarate ferredoxin oxidoreductase subunit beta